MIDLYGQEHDGDLSNMRIQIGYLSSMSFIGADGTRHETLPLGVRVLMGSPISPSDQAAGQFLSEKQFFTTPVSDIFLERHHERLANHKGGWFVVGINKVPQANTNNDVQQIT